MCVWTHSLSTGSDASESHSTESDLLRSDLISEADFWLISQYLTSPTQYNRDYVHFFCFFQSLKHTFQQTEWGFLFVSSLCNTLLLRETVRQRRNDLIFWQLFFSPSTLSTYVTTIAQAFLKSGYDANIYRKLPWGRMQRVFHRGWWFALLVVNQSFSY